MKIGVHIRVRGDNIRWVSVGVRVQYAVCLCATYESVLLIQDDDDVPPVVGQVSRE